MNELQQKVSRILKESGHSLSELQSITGVHRSQLSRFRNGKFLTHSANLEKVLRVLQKSRNVAKRDEALIEAVHGVWDGTANGKRRLIRFLRTLGEWRGAS